MSGCQLITELDVTQSSDDLRGLISEARQSVAQAVNAALSILYWKVGERIRQDILKEERAEYGKEIVVTVSRQLMAEFGRGFSRRNLFNMIRFAELFPDFQIVHTLCAQLSWSHFRQILSVKDPLQRDFYAELSRIEGWSVRTLQKKIDGMLFERTALSRKPAELARQELETLREEDKLTPDLVFRDPYFLDFLGLKDTYAEKDLESAILRELEAFILELGVGFSFVARQKRMTVDSEDYYLDLLFFHRKLRRLVAIDLKLGKFKAADKGQMELYLRWSQNLRSLSIRDLDAEECCLRLDANWTKNRKEDRQPIPMYLCEMLAEFARAGNAKTLYEETYPRRDGASHSIPDEPLLYVECHPGMSLDRIIERTDVEKTTVDGKIDFHAFRTTFGTILNDLGTTEKEIQVLLRHRPRSVTFDRYVKTRPGRILSLVEGLGELVQGAASGIESTTIAQPIAVGGVSNYHTNTNWRERVGVEPTWSIATPERL